MSRRTIFVAMASMVALTHASFATDTSKGEWPYYGGDAAGRKYSPLTQIDASNVKSLGIAWSWDSPDNALVSAATTRERPGSFKATPLMIDGVLYTSTGFNQVAAIDAASGKT